MYAWWKLVLSRYLLVSLLLVVMHRWCICLNLAATAQKNNNKFAFLKYWRIVVCLYDALNDSGHSEKLLVLRRSFDLLPSHLVFATIFAPTYQVNYSSCSIICQFNLDSEHDADQCPLLHQSSFSTLKSYIRRDLILKLFFSGVLSWETIHTGLGSMINRTTRTFVLMSKDDS